MSEEEIDEYKQGMKEQRNEMLQDVIQEKQSVQRTRLYRLHGTKKQYEFLRQQRGICRHLYNLCLSDMKAHYKSNKNIIHFLYFLLNSDEIELTEAEITSIKKNIYEYMFLSEKILRTKYQSDSYWIDNNKLWGLLIPSNLRTFTIKNLLSNTLVAYKTSKCNFNMRFLSKKQDKLTYQISVSTQQINIKTGTVISSDKSKKDVLFQYMNRKCPNEGKFTVRVYDKDKFPNSKLDFQHDCRLIYRSGCWYIAISSDVNINPPVDITRACAIDLGCKTPATVYDPQDGSITEIGGSNDSLERIKDQTKTLSSHARLERLRRLYRRGQSRLSIQRKKSFTRKEKHKCKRIERYLRRISFKKKYLIDELHYKMIQYLTSNYDVIIMPYFDTQRMIKSKKLSKKSKRALLDLNFSLFRQRLINKVEIQGKIWLEVDESYTTKSCVRCGHIKQHMGLTQRTFECQRCHLKLGRDAHSAISILVKNAELVFT